MLGSTLTIEDRLDESHALAYHQVEDESGELVRSRVGSVMYAAKYEGDENAATKIEGALVSFIRRHPAYRRSRFVAAVPPHEKGTRQSLCRRLVESVSARTGSEAVVVTRTETRPQQKGIVDEDRQAGVRRRIENQQGSMQIQNDLSSSSIVVIDDLYGSGASMMEAARAARAASASEVLGLAVTKQRLFEGVRITSQD